MEFSFGYEMRPVWRASNSPKRRSQLVGACCVLLHLPAINCPFGPGLPSAPTWCVQTRQLQRWMERETCANVEVDCAATDVCATSRGLFHWTFSDTPDIDLRCVVGQMAVAAVTSARLLPFIQPRHSTL